MTTRSLILAATLSLLFTWRLEAAERLPLHIFTADHPHSEAIRNGTIPIPECQVAYSTGTTLELIRQWLNGPNVDVIEVDWSIYLKQYAAEKKHNWVLIPVFLIREFPQRHIVDAKDGLQIDNGNPTLELWAKGILESSAATKAASIWNPPTRRSSVPPSPYYPDPRTVEEQYFRETRIFPIVSALAIRQELVDDQPWLPEALFIAFSEAKSKALAADTMPWPWGIERREETVQLMKKNFWSYGIKNNPKTLGALFRYAREQGLISKNLKPEDVFARETLMLIDEKGSKN